MGRASREKGARTEREAVAILQDAGIAAVKIPLSGACGGRFAGDITAPVLGVDRLLEVKCRAAGFTEIYRWIGLHYAVVIRRDRAEPLVVVRLKDFAQLAIRADKERLT